MPHLKQMNREELIQIGYRYRGQIVRSSAASDIDHRRIGQFRSIIEGLLDGSVSHEDAQAALSAHQPQGKSQFHLVADIVDSAVDHVSGVEGAMDKLLAAATSLKDYDAEKVIYMRSGASSDSAAAKPKSDSTFTLDEAHEAMKSVATALEESGDADPTAVLGRDFEAIGAKIGLTITRQDVIETCGSWTNAQKGSGLKVTGRGYRKSAA